MDDVYQINLAKTDFREAYNTGNVELLLSVFSPGSLADLSESGPSKFGTAAISAQRAQASALFAEYRVKMTPIIIDIVVNGNIAYDFGWHEFTLIPKSGGETIRKRQRYFEMWKKDQAGKWLIAIYIDNADVREELNGFASHWFLSEETSSAPVN